MESMALPAEQRAQRGSRKAKKLREGGRIPAIVYGHKEEPQAVTVSAEDIETAIRHHSRTFDLQLDGSSQSVLIKELQWDHLGVEVMHIDFLRVSADERVRVEIPIEFKGEAPGAAQGVFQHPLQAFHVECLALSQPQSIRVDIGEMQLGDTITVADVTFPEGVTALDPPEAVVAHIAQPVEETEEETEEPGEGHAEPEKIGEGKEEKETESDEK